VQVMKLFCT